ncbi:MAG: pyridoxal phosphate-dependent aminotransferase [Gammaproteobacteria bacterium]|jgi:aspartate aminotransferase|nr:pyridoxal phosphate-dependent aminotransferase [Gammaproteobacteria bacterium]
MARLSARILNIKPSPTLGITAKAAELKRQGRDIISLSIGEPDFDTPEHIKMAAIKAIEAGQTKYTAVEGTLELRQAICAKLKQDNHLDYSPKQILVSSGAKQSIYNLLGAILNPGDEAIIPAPFWVSYPDMVVLFEGKPVIVPTKLENRLKLSPDELEAAITPKTKLVMLNSPSNPTGVAYTKNELASLAEVLKRHPQVLICSDDIYEKIWWLDEAFSNILMVCPELYDRTIVVNGVSKSYAMTGWRIGYAAGPLDIITAMNNLQSQSTSNACSISQAAATTALNGDQNCLGPMVKAFKEKHDFMIEQLNSIPGFMPLAADGAFYVFVNIDKAIQNLSGIDNDVQFAEYLLDKADVAVVPGSAFGLDGYIRISYATSLEKLKLAMQRIKALFKAL